MAYVRKTYDAWTVQGNYGQGWEDVFEAENRKQAREILQDYQKNCKYSYRLKFKRFNIENN